MTTPASADEQSAPSFFIDSERPAQLAARIGIEIHDPRHFQTALTHRSVLHEWAAIHPDAPLPDSNERLEFLGDAFLGLIVAEELFHTEPDAQEGDLTSWRVSFVRAERLVTWAREIGLGELLYLGTGERITSGARDRMLAGAFEALIGAIALDRGLEAARSFVLRFVHRDLDQVTSRTEQPNPKGTLQELLQQRYRSGPTYEIVATEGPDHARLFTSQVNFNGQSLGAGQGGSKRDAEQAAASDALARLDRERDLLDRLNPAEPGILNANG